MSFGEIKEMFPYWRKYVTVAELQSLHPYTMSSSHTVKCKKFPTMTTFIGLPCSMDFSHNFQNDSYTHKLYHIAYFHEVSYKCCFIHYEINVTCQGLTILFTKVSPECFFLYCDTLCIFFKCSKMTVICKGLPHCVHS